MKEFNSSGELIIQDATIAEPGSPVNKSYVDASVSGKADISYVDSVVSPMAEKSYVDGLVPLGSFMGTGSPEGAVSAPVGSIYVDSAATNGAIRWIKTSGTGSTGWRVEYGDTGWRDYTDVPGGIKSGQVLIRRKESRLFLHLETMTPDSTGTNFSLGRLPVGFRGTGFTTRWTMADGSFTNPEVFTGNVSKLGYVNIYGTFSKEPALTGTASYLTTEPWPSSLPGTPA